MVDTVIVEAETPVVSAVSWPAVIAGGFVAAAFTLLLLALGAGIGFSVVSPWSGLPDMTTTKAALVGGIYMAVTAVMASALGGYVTGRLRVRWARTPLDEVYFRDTAHGVLAWAFATVMGAALLASAATVVGSGAAANPAPAGTTTANDITAPFLDRLFRPNYAVLTGGTGQQAAGVFAAGRDLAADRDVARRMLLNLPSTATHGDCHGPLYPALAARRSYPHHHPAGAVLALRRAAGLDRPQRRIIATRCRGRPNAPDRVGSPGCAGGSLCATVCCLSLA